MTTKTTPLDEQIEVVGFKTKVEFQNKEGEKIYINATKGEEGCKVKDIKTAVQNFKEDLDNYLFLSPYKKTRLNLALTKHFGKSFVETSNEHERNKRSKES